MAINSTGGDILNNKIPSKIGELSDDQLSVLLENIVLNVIADAEGKYLLLAPNLIYNLLIQHPAAKNVYVNLLLHTPENEQELLSLIDTLNLVQPALSLLESANKSKNIHARFLKLNEMDYEPTSLTLLANLANKDKSTFRG